MAIMGKKTQKRILESSKSSTIVRPIDQIWVTSQTANDSFCVVFIVVVNKQDKLSHSIVKGFNYDSNSLEKNQQSLYLEP